MGSLRLQSGASRLTRLLTLDQFAEAVGISRRTAEDWVLKRKVDVVRPGGRLVRVPEAEVSRIIEESTTPRIN
jgi:excisionase family DNA binding protein